MLTMDAGNQSLYHKRKGCPRTLREITSVWVPGGVWLQDWNLKELTEGHHQAWSLRLNLTQHGETYQTRTFRGLTDERKGFFKGRDEIKRKKEKIKKRERQTLSQNSHTRWKKRENEKEKKRKKKKKPNSWKRTLAWKKAWRRREDRMGYCKKKSNREKGSQIPEAHLPKDRQSLK